MGFGKVGGGAGGEFRRFLGGLGRTHLLLHAVIRLHVKEGPQIGQVEEGEGPQRPIQRPHPQCLQVGGGETHGGGLHPQDHPPPRPLRGPMDFVGTALCAFQDLPSQNPPPPKKPQDLPPNKDPQPTPKPGPPTKCSETAPNGPTPPKTPTETPP